MSELLALTPRIPTTDEARMLVFEESDGSIRQLQQLESVQGISDTRTEMLFNFQPLHVEQSSASLRVRRPSIERTYSEDLILDGGVNALEASWRWCKPHLALGGVVLRRRMA